MFGYDIDGLVRIKTSIRLPELAFFRTPSVSDPDIVIRTRPVGGWAPRTNVAVSYKSGRIEYREHLGPLFANFSVDMADPVVVTAGPLLALSPHVLYTNVVEPLLRFILASKDKMLLHAACISVGGRPIMLSAKTDTGKTSTILTMLRADGGIFYSDDMVIIDANGVASRYPKPLTISAHTLRAVPQNRLKLSQRLSLSWQSRLHSREGRSVGKKLGAANLPIMSMNAVVQAVIPPPKYRVTDLVSCVVGTQVRMEASECSTAPRLSLSRVKTLWSSCWRTPRTPMGSRRTARWLPTSRFEARATSTCVRGSGRSSRRPCRPSTCRESACPTTAGRRRSTPGQGFQRPCRSKSPPSRLRSALWSGRERQAARPRPCAQGLNLTPW